MRWPGRVSRPVTAGRLSLSVMSAGFTIFGLSMIFQPHRWESTPAYHVLLLIFPAQAWGALFLASGMSMGAAVWQYGRRWAVVAALTLAVALTAGWMLAFIARYLTSGNTTPETWVSWAVFGYLLLQAAAGLDRPRDAPDPPEIAAFRQAVSDALDAAERDRAAVVARALGDRDGKLRAGVSAACDAYAEALRSVIPAGDPARAALDEARNALRRAEEAYGRATGQPP